MSAKPQKKSESVYNSYLHEKCRLLVGKGGYIPPSYLHLGHYWKCVEKREFIKGEEYSLLRGLVLKSQGRKTVWSHKIDKFQCSSWEMTLEQQRHIERLWRQMVQTLSCHDIGLLDWLVHEAILYDLPREIVRGRINKAVCILQRL